MNWRTRPWPVLLDRQVRRDRPSRRHSVSPAVVLHAHDDLLRRDSPGRVGPQRRPTVSDARFGKKRANCRRFAVRGAITARGRSRWRQVRSDIAVAGRISSGCSTRARESLLWPGRLGRSREAVAYRYRRRGPQRCRSLPGSRGPRLISRRQRKPRSRRQTLGPRPRPYPGRPPRPVDGPRQRTPGLERQVPRSARAVVPGVAVVRGAHGRDFGSMTRPRTLRVTVSAGSAQSSTCPLAAARAAKQDACFSGQPEPMRRPADGIRSAAERTRIYWQTQLTA
jgi:hypothetical protein